MVTTFRLAALAVAACALLPLSAHAAPKDIVVGIDNGCIPNSSLCTIVQGDWGVKVVRGDPNCPAPSGGYGTGTYLGLGNWAWFSCTY